MNDKQEFSNVEALRRMQTAESVLLPIPRDTFEKLYLTPKMPTAGNLRQTFGNPTPISLMGFLTAATPNAMLIMGWGGAGGGGGAILPVYIFFGGVIQIIGAIAEWVLGNTFSCAVFFTYGAFWLSQGASLIPSFAVGVNYSPTGNTLEGKETMGYNATAGLYYVVLAFLTLIYLLCSLRTNICFFLALFFLVIAYSLYAAVYFYVAYENHEMAAKMEMAAGAFNLVLCVPIWYIFIAQMLESIDFPIALPVGDLSKVVRGRTEKARQRIEENEA